MSISREGHAFLVWATFAAAAWATGCGHQSGRVGGGGAGGAGAGSTAANTSPGILPPPDAIPGTFAVRQKIVARSAHGSGSFEAVLQKEPGKLTLLGFTPYGGRAFLLEQSAAGGVKLTSFIPRELPFSPDFILMDIHRVLDAWLGPPPTTDGERSGAVRDEVVRERWAGGRLTSRSFASASNPAQVITTVTYEGAAPAGVPAKVSIANARFGYDLTIVTLAM